MRNDIYSIFSDYRQSYKLRMIRNRLDKSFGPAGSSAGVFLFVAGLVATYFSLIGLVLVVLGAFVGFSGTSTLLDTDKKRIRFSNDLFGIIPTGKWIEINPEMKIGLKKSNRINRAYSRSNRTLDVPTKDFRLVLLGPNNKEIIPIMKTRSHDSAKIELEKLGSNIGLGYTLSDI